MQQAATIQPSSTPGGPVLVSQTTLEGVPTTRAEYRALVDKRSALSDQLISASGRRTELAEQLNATHPDARKGILDRLEVLDERIVKLEQEIERTGVLVANAPRSLATVASTSPASQGPGLGSAIGENIIPLTAIVSTFVLLPLAIAMARAIWRRGSHSERSTLTDVGAQRQLEQMQQSIDAIAIEVERISEGQRFMSKMLNTGSRAGHQSAVPAERG